MLASLTFVALQIRTLISLAGRERERMGERGRQDGTLTSLDGRERENEKDREIKRETE